MAADIQLLLEAEKRGLLPPEKRALLDEARSRGLIPGREGIDFMGLQRGAENRRELERQDYLIENQTPGTRRIPLHERVGNDLRNMDVGGMLNKAGYEIGGKVTDLGAEFGNPPNVAAGIGMAANVGFQAIPSLLGFFNSSGPAIQAAGVINMCTGVI